VETTVINTSCPSYVQNQIAETASTDISCPSKLQNQNIETIVTSVETKSEHAVMYAEKSETVDETTKEVGNDPKNTSEAHMLEELQPNTIVDKEIQSSEHQMDTSGPDYVLDGTGNGYFETTNPAHSVASP